MHKFVLQTLTLLSFTKTVVLDMGQELYWCWEAECDQVNTNNSTSLQITNQNTHKINFATVHKNIVILVAGARWQWQCTTWAPWRWDHWSSPLSGWLWSAWSGSTTGSRRWTVGGPGKESKQINAHFSSLSEFYPICQCKENLWSDTKLWKSEKHNQLSSGALCLCANAVCGA